MVAGSNDNRIYMFNRNGLMWSYHTGDSFVSVAISSNGDLIAAASSSGDHGKVYLFNKTSSTPLWNFGEEYVFSVDISSDGNYIVSGSGRGEYWEDPPKGEVTIFNKNSSTPLWTYHTINYINSVAISSNGELIAATSARKRFLFFNRQSSAPIWIHPFREFPEDLAMSHNGKYVAIGLKSGNLLSFDTSTRSIMWNLMFINTIESVDISLDGGYIVASDHSGNVFLIANTGMDIIILITSLTGIAVIIVTTGLVILIRKKRNLNLKTKKSAVQNLLMILSRNIN